MKLAVPALAVVVLAGCSKTEGGTGAATAEPPPPPTFQIVGTAPSASPSATAAVAASAAAPAAASASAAATAAASGSAKPAAAASSAAKEKEVPLKPAATKIAGKNFALDVASPGCRVDQPCAVTIRLSATGDYHVNKEYPYKFTAAAAPGVTFLGNGDASTFSRAAGDFKEEGEKIGTMTVRFKPSSAGNAKVSGTYKMSVCSAENCQIEQQAVSLDVPVL